MPHENVIVVSPRFQLSPFVLSCDVISDRQPLQAYRVRRFRPLLVEQRLCAQHRRLDQARRARPLRGGQILPRGVLGVQRHLHLIL